MVYIQISASEKCPKCLELALNTYSDTKKFYLKCFKCGYDQVQRRCGC